MAVKKEGGGTEENRENCLGDSCELDFSTGRKIKMLPSWGNWEFKDSDLSGIGGTWKRACIPWSGLANCILSFPSNCFILKSILFTTPKIIHVGKNVTLAGNFWVSKEYKTKKPMKKEKDGSSWPLSCEKAVLYYWEPKRWLSNSFLTLSQNISSQTSSY